MSIDELKSLRDAAPFQAFQLHLSNGDVIPVRHPEYLSLPPLGEGGVFIAWIDSHWSVIDSGHIARVSKLGGQSAPAKS